MKWMRRGCLITIMSMLICFQTYATEIKDLDEHWAKDIIQDAITDGWVTGYGDGTFKPKDPVKRIEFLKMLIASSNDFLRINSGRVYPEAYIETAKAMGLSVDEELYEPLTRNEVCQIFADYIDVSGIKAPKINFDDLDDKEYDTVSKMVQMGIVKGYDDNTFRGTEQVSRAEAVVMIQRAMKAKKEKALQTKYTDLDIKKYSNYQGHEINGTNYDEISFEINNRTLWVTDERNSMTKKKIESDIFDVPKAIKVIQNLTNEVGYVGVQLFSSEVVPSELIIAYGQNEKRVANHTNEITITYYQDKYYDLKDKSRVDMFSSTCYMQISVIQLWQDLHLFKKGEFVDEFLIGRIEKGLEGEFSKKEANEITNFIKDKVSEMFSREDHYDAEFGQMKVGNYQIDYYKAENDIPRFFVSKVS